ncbi:MAG: glycosyltransferase family 2 protein [Leptolyngbyaceae cyanobacterium SL_1_1]|nr:glycosyltransferase family 2 protein [Leptolyngbyaceae cyanobacterium RM1_1_2]NJO11426.1 glycosyltransferase family 2 protein [Leptolyngbyaceae cyanobacterium SL_1_1]
MRLTLITPYRDRLSHLTNQLNWWLATPRLDLEWIVVQVTPDPEPTLQQTLQAHQVRYLHLACGGPFHKTRALNLALHQAQGDLIAAFDVDLIPLGATLQRHCWLAARSPQLLVTGYRLMAPTETVDLTTAALKSALEQSTLGPEDQPTALRKHLLQGERFGVMPLFQRDRLLRLGGWDQTFVGWGAEDQDLIERYLTPDQALCRCPELVYLHLQHGPAPDWQVPSLIQRNRQHYYSRRLSQRQAKSELSES